MCLKNMLEQVKYMIFQYGMISYYHKHEPENNTCKNQGKCY